MTEDLTTLLIHTDWKGDKYFRHLKYTIKLERVTTEHEKDPMRTPSITGITDFPEVGKQLYMLAEGLEIPNSNREFYTSPILKIWNEGEDIHLQTENSRYKLRILGVIK